jgi:hypothetical protein
MKFSDECFFYLNAPATQLIFFFKDFVDTNKAAATVAEKEDGKVPEVCYFYRRMSRILIWPHIRLIQKPDTVPDIR